MQLAETGPEIDSDGPWASEHQPTPEIHAPIDLSRLRCCLCRWPSGLEETDLPGSGARCADHDACRQRVADIVTAHQAWGEIVG